MNANGHLGTARSKIRIDHINFQMLRIAQVMVFDVVLYLCDLITDLLQIYFLFQGITIEKQYWQYGTNING